MRWCGLKSFSVLFWLLLGGSAQAAWTVVQFNTVQTTSTTCAATFSSSVTAGNLLVALFVGFNTSSYSLSSVGDNNSNTWTIDEPGTFAQRNLASIASAPNANSGSTTVTATASTSVTCSMVIVELSGAATSSVNDGHTATSAPFTTNPDVSVTTATNNAILLGIITHDGATTTITEGFTLIAEDEGTANDPYNAQYRTLGAAGNYDLTWTLGSARNVNVALAAYKAGAAPPPASGVRHRVVQ